MEFVQFHPTHMVWPLSVAGLLVTESVRGDGGVLRNSEGKRFMFGYVPDVFRPMYAETEEEADRWYDDQASNRRPPELLPRDEVARSIRAEVKAGRGSPHGGVFLDIASRRPAEEILRKLPSMYHQFKELADVDITREPMEVGPAQHYVMGGVEVDADSGAALVPGLFAAGEVSGGMHGSNRLGGNSLSDLLVFGRRAGAGAADYLDAIAARPAVPAAAVAEARAEALAPLGRAGGANPYTVHAEVQQTMSDLVGIIRREEEIKTALTRLDKLRERAAKVSAPGGSAYNPGWHLALDLRNILLIAECVALAALERQESRGGHTRDDYPAMSPEWRKVNLVCSLDGGGRVVLCRQPIPPIRPDLLALFDVAELQQVHDRRGAGRAARRRRDLRGGDTLTGYRAALRVAVRVRPGAARTAVGGRHGDALVVHVTARPAGGAATQAVLRAVAEAFGVPRRDVTLVTGAISRDKVIEVAGPAGTAGPAARRTARPLTSRRPDAYQRSAVTAAGTSAPPAWAAPCVARFVNCRDNSSVRSLGRAGPRARPRAEGR